MRRRVTAAVVGGGPAGIATALSLGRAGADVVLAAPPHRTEGQAPDNRTAALFAGSIELLKNVGAWETIAPQSAPITGIRIIDDTGALLRAPEVVFTASEVGLDVFGWNVPNGALVSGLLAAAAQPGSRVALHATQGVATVTPGAETISLTTREGDEFDAALVAGADGRNSLCRTAAGIETRTWRYEQAAIATSFHHTRPHRSISTEFHRPAGPFTTVPLPGLRSSLVWVERPDEAQRLAALSEADFRAILEERLQGLLGTVGEIGPRAVFPLSGLTAKRFGLNRVALVGEAGHVIPPIGAQGLNLGFRDAATLADCVADALAQGRDPGGAATLDAYSARRKPDVSSRITTIDVLNRSLISDLVPVHLARGLGIVALKALGPLRRFAIREGLQPSRELPALLLPDGARLLAQRASPSHHSAA
ncbi:UbiH/UbiF family hydroxylase [Hyphomicrobium sp. DMF-1]|jgi:2-octaprenyl-6-methoxyphenol hydroxylase|uniref:UbiH/UbiF family hydroxylase n=1 Tax=Hyphomicrobium sp. DMF-1 TaxID=3019544 RepID=UPI0022EBAEFD|nr:UbiH/UbiF family hydroxylase [Hyphomicrobium sp. DMF-1]WBT37055.1 UbiH/UbiF family hydroxylase [Hyphomicrobium sp. DMF-1]